LQRVRYEWELTPIVIGFIVSLRSVH
jgi:hypothetical protein